MKVAIIGGGITGLTTAIALAEKGIKSTVYEQTSELREVGAGIWLQPNAMTILKQLGLKDEIQKSGFEINKMEIGNSKLIPFKTIKKETVEDLNGNRTIAIHRGRLQKLLYEKAIKVCNVKLDCAYISHKFHDGEYVIKFKHGVEKADIILGADGINSKVRQQIFPDSKLRDAKQVCWRGISDFTLPKDFYSKGQENWGQNIRFGFSQISPKKVYWFAVLKTKNEISDGNKKQDLIERFSKFNSLVKEIITNTPEKAIHKGILADLKPIPKWYDGHILLLGDAGHATTPNMGQGACQGIEDAFFISELLNKHTTPLSAFQEFEKIRRKKVNYIVNASWKLGQAAHNPLGRSFIISLMKLTPEKIMSKQMKKLFEVQSI